MVPASEEEVKKPLNGDENSSPASSRDSMGESDSVTKGSRICMDAEKAVNLSVERGVWGSQVEFVMTCISYAGSYRKAWKADSSPLTLLLFNRELRYEKD